MTETKSTAASAPAQGSAVKSIPSAGDDPKAASAIVLADPTNVVTIDGNTAAKTDPGQGPGGMALATGEVGGGNIKATLEPPIVNTAATAGLTKERAALLSPVGQKLAGYIGRPPSEWGVIAEGETVKGSMLLLDLNSGEKVRAGDGHVVNKGGLFLNLRNLPESLSTGDAIDQILKGAK